jgi:hypothetical protein
MWMLVTLVVAILGITVSNFVGASGSVTGSGSSIASKLSWSIGAISTIAFLVLCVSALRARRTARH